MKPIKAYAGIMSGKIRWEMGVDCDFPYLPIFKHKKDCELDHYDEVIEVRIVPLKKKVRR